MRIGMAADHGGFESKVQLTAALNAAGYEVADFGAHHLATGMTARVLRRPWPGRWRGARSPGAWPSAAAG